MGKLSFVKDISFHQRVPRDDLVHHLMGNGLIQLMVQVTENRRSRNALAIHLMNPRRFRQKADSFTFHRELGPELTGMMVFYEGDLFLPNPHQTARDFKYQLDFGGGSPMFRASYPLDYTLGGERAKTPFTVEETLICPPGLPAVLRRFRLVNSRGLDTAAARIFAFLVPNQGLFPEAHFLAEHTLATAGHFGQGDEFLGLVPMSPIAGHQVNLFPDPLDAAFGGTLDSAASMDGERFVRPDASYTNYPLLPGSPHLGPVMALEFDPGSLAEDAEYCVEVAYVYGHSEDELVGSAHALRKQNFNDWAAADRAHWAGLNAVRTDQPRWNTFYRAARAGIRAGVAADGAMDACIWGFNAEWVRDSSLACIGAILSGQFDLARAMLTHILQDLVQPSGLAFGEGRFYALEHAEPDQNGELLYALWTYWVHSRDAYFIREHFDLIEAVAEFPLGPAFFVEEASMVKSERDIRERDRERHGMEPGYELAYQFWVSLGLEKAAQMARQAGRPDQGERWDSYAERIWDAALHHPQFALVENGYLMKRRLLDGSFQRFAVPKPYIHRVYGDLTRMYPRGLHRRGELEPDHSESYPIALGKLDPKSGLAKRTLKRMEQLWNQEWDFGGYPLHHAGSEPTKLGAHLLPIQLITQAALEARQYETVRRNVDYLLDAKDGRGYTWWEYRDADPGMQIDHGLPPWFGYSEPLVLFVHHLVGYRPQPDGIVFNPHLLPEMKHLQARLRFGNFWLDLQINHAGERLQSVFVNGQPWHDFTDEMVVLPVVQSDTRVEIIYS